MQDTHIGVILIIWSGVEKYVPAEETALLSNIDMPSAQLLAYRIFGRNPRRNHDYRRGLLSRWFFITPLAVRQDVIDQGAG